MAWTDFVAPRRANGSEPAARLTNGQLVFNAALVRALGLKAGMRYRLLVDRDWGRMGVRFGEGEAVVKLAKAGNLAVRGGKTAAKFALADADMPKGALTIVVEKKPAENAPHVTVHLRPKSGGAA